jgi:hypothetical protein
MCRAGPEVTDEMTDLKGSPYIFGAPAPYEEVYLFCEGMAAVKLGGKWGYADTSGALAVPAVYDEVFDFNLGAACVVRDGRASLIDKQGRVILETDYGWLRRDADGLIQVRDAKTRLFGCMNPALELVIPCKYGGFLAFGGGNLAMVYTGKMFHAERPAKFGFVNRGGEEVVPLVYSEAKPFRGGYAEVCAGGFRNSGSGWGLIDEAGHAVIAPQYREIAQLDGLAVFREPAGRMGMISVDGNLILPPEYDSLYLCGDGVVGGRKGNYCGLFNADGSQLLPFSYNDLCYHWNDLELLGAATGGKAGYIDRYGNVKIPFIYDDVQEFTHGRAAVEKDGKLGMIDTVGDALLPVLYDDIGPVYRELTVAKKGNSLVVLSGSDAVLPPLPGARCYRFQAGRAWLKYDGLWVILGQPE